MKMAQAKNWSPKVMIIGAGISGILSAIKLKEIGISDITIVEKGDGLGGTWHWNTYPGAACDVPAHLYLYSFELKSDWKNLFASGPDIKEYLIGTAKKYGVFNLIKYNCDIVSAQWSGTNWDLRSSSCENFKADIVISAVGRLRDPKYPDIKGLEDFAGPIMHTARWDHKVDLRGKRIGLIGNGSSGVQVLSALSKTAALVTLFQRTPHWVVHTPNPPVPWWLPTFLRYVPGAKRYWYRKMETRLAERHRYIAQEDRSEYDAIALTSLDRIRDPQLRRRLTPSYRPGCKRMVRSPDFFDVMQSRSVELVQTKIDRVDRSGIVTDDGTLHEIDALVLATGFKADAFLRPMTVTGKDDVTLDEIWAEMPLNYRSVALPGMPNFFTVNGPYSPGGSNSIVAVAEVHVSYIVKCVEHIVSKRVAIAPRLSTTKAWLEGIRKKASSTIWVTGGCKSWYLGADGVPIVNPATVSELQEDMKTVKLDDFVEFSVA